MEEERIFKVNMGSFWEIRREINTQQGAYLSYKIEYLHCSTLPALYFWKDSRVPTKHIWAEKESLIDEHIENYRKQINPVMIEVRNA